MTRRTVFLLLVTTAVLALPAAPAAATSGPQDLPTDLFDPVAPQQQESSGLPAAAIAGGLLLVALAGFAVGEAMPARRVRRAREESWIALWRSGTTAEFRVVVGHGPRRRIIGRSERFPAPAHGPLGDDGPARAAFEDLVARLQGLGWQPVGAGRHWYSLRLAQPESDEQLALA